MDCIEPLKIEWSNLEDDYKRRQRNWSKESRQFEKVVRIWCRNLGKPSKAFFILK